MLNIYILIYLDTLCFNRSAYWTSEDNPPLAMTLLMSRPVPFDITVRFQYMNENARGELVMYYVIG